MVTRWGVSRSRAAWWAVGAALLVVLGFVVYSFIGTFVFGVFIYYSTRPVYRRLRRRIRPAGLAALVALLVLALPALLLIAYTLAIGLQEVSRLIQTTELTQVEALLQPYIDISRIAQNPDQLLNQPDVRTAIQQLADNTLNYVGFVGNAALHLFVMISIAFYLLRDDRRLSAWFRETFPDETVERYGRAVDRDLKSIFFGNILNVGFTGAIAAVVYLALDFIAPSPLAIPYPAVIGLLTGVASLVPLIGMKLVYVPMAGYVTFVTVRVDPQLLWFPLVFTVVSLVVVDLIPDLVLRPYVSGRGLHIGMVMFAYIFGPLLFGWYGIFLGPMLLVFIVHFVRIVVPVLVGREGPTDFREAGFEPAEPEQTDGES